jgi:hypothetical protein
MFLGNVRVMKEMTMTGLFVMLITDLKFALWTTLLYALIPLIAQETVVGSLQEMLAALVEIRLWIGIFLENVGLGIRERIVILMLGQKFVR